MFKFKCAGNFDDKSIITRNYNDKSNPPNPPIVIASKSKPSTKLASTSDYLFDLYPDENGNKDYRGKNIIDFPEIKDANSCLTTNDGLVIFNYNKDNYCIVYDLVYDNETTFNNVGVDIQNHIDLIEYCKYTSPRVHCLDIVNRQVKPDIKFIDSSGTYHFFVDCDLDTNAYPLDEYSYYTYKPDNNTSENKSIPEINTIRFNKRGKILVSNFYFDGMDKYNNNNTRYYYMLIDSNTDVIDLNIAGMTGKCYICY